MRHKFLCIGACCGRSGRFVVLEWKRPTRHAWLVVGTLLVGGVLLLLAAEAAMADEGVDALPPPRVVVRRGAHDRSPVAPSVPVGPVAEVPAPVQPRHLAPSVSPQPVVSAQAPHPTANLAPSAVVSAASPEFSASDAPLCRDVEVEFSGYMQLWATVIEQTENGLVQPRTGDGAAQETSGFSLHRVRLAADIDAHVVRGRFEIGLEGTPRILDAWAAASFLGGRAEFWAGQMKVPSTYEVATPSSGLDFATRSTFSRQVVDWSLCRSPSNPSPFFGVRTYLRDLGVGLKGQVGAFRYFFMVGNGLGANLFIGGREDKEYLFANDFGAYFCGARASVELTRLFAGSPRWLRSFEVGGHYASNDHPDAVFNDETTVLDIERWSWSADCRVDILNRVRLTGMIGAGAVEDDFDADGKKDYEYSGWEVKAVVPVVRDRLALALRHDVYEDEYFENGAVGTLRTTTAGVTWTPNRFVRLQLNYLWKSLDSPVELDLEDDLLLLVAQFQF